MGNKHFYEGAWMLAALIATLIALGFATNKVLKQPTVVKSWSTQKCLWIENEQGEKVSCYPLPARYALRWVE